MSPALVGWEPRRECMYACIYVCGVRKADFTCTSNYSVYSQSGRKHFSHLVPFRQGLALDRGGWRGGG